MTKPDWIAVDWGTTTLRGWAMSNDGQPGEMRHSAQGMNNLLPNGFESALMQLIEGWHSGPTTVVACGMLGARQGWVEVPYAKAPCPLAPASLTIAPAITPELSVHIVPGISQESPADVMRGEETQIAGFLAHNPDWDGVVCLPGSHTKWTHISAGELVSFQSFMTGDLFAALSSHSVLRHTVAETGWNQTAFETAVDAAISRPERLAARLFSLRAEALLHDLQGDIARARLSGTLIGAELAASKPYWLGQRICVIGSAALAANYASALKTQAVHADCADATTATIAGLTAAYQQLKGLS